MNTLIIAEAGVNHNGDIDMALRLIDAAAEAGADIVKFQTFRADSLVTMEAQKAPYQRVHTDSEESQHTMLQRLELSRESHEVLIGHAASRGIGFLSTGFDVESIDMLVELGMTQFKVPSGEITNLPYLRHVGHLDGSVLLSTGMATLAEIEAALDVLEGAGTPRSRITVLHCTTEYPTPMEEVNLHAMVAIGQAFKVKVGYSDHTLGIEVATAAVALGATMIEKHFTLGRHLPGPDHEASVEPRDLGALVTSIRNVERALGDGIKRPTPSEVRNRPAARKSIVAARAIEAGERFTDSNLAVKRPGTGLTPMRWDEALGRVASRAFLADEAIEL